MNQYYTPAQVNLQDYYVGRPIGMIAELAGQQQKAYDTGLANIDAVDETFKIDAHESEARLAKDLINQYKTKLADIENKFIKTGDPRVASEAKKLAQQFANDPYKITIEQNKKGYLEEEKRQSELTATDKGWKGYNFLNDVYARNRKATSLDQLSPFNPTGDFRYYRTKQNIPEAANNIMKDIAKDSGEFRDLMSEVNGELTWKKHGYKDRVTLDKVVRVAEHSTENFLNSDAGKFFIDDKLGFAVQNFEDLPDKYKTELRREATRMLANTAYKQIGGGVTDEDYKQFDDVLRRRGFAKQDAETIAGTADLLDAETKQNNVYNNSLKALDDVEKNLNIDLLYKDAKGNVRSRPRTNEEIKRDLPKDQSRYLDALASMYFNSGEKGVKGVYNILKEGSAEDKKKAAELANSIMKDGKIDYRKLVKKHREIIENTNTLYNKHLKFNEAQQEAFNFMTNDLANRNIFNVDGTVAELPTEDGTQYHITGIEGPTSSKPGYLQLVDKNTNTKYLVQPNKQLEQKVTKSMLSLQKAVENPQIFGTIYNAAINGDEILPEEGVKLYGKLSKPSNFRFVPVKYTDGTQIKIKYVPEILSGTKDGKPVYKEIKGDALEEFRKETGKSFDNVENMLIYIKDRASKEGTIGNYWNTKLNKPDQETTTSTSSEPNYDHYINFNE